MQWFLGEEQIIGDTATEEDIRIEHTRDEDKLWFYATSFGAPLPLLAFGLWIALKRRRRRETHKPQSEADTEPDADEGQAPEPGPESEPELEPDPESELGSSGSEEEPEEESRRLCGYIWCSSWAGSSGPTKRGRPKMRPHAKRK